MPAAAAANASSVSPWPAGYNILLPDDRTDVFGAEKDDPVEVANTGK